MHFAYLLLLLIAITTYALTPFLGSLLESLTGLPLEEEVRLLSLLLALLAVRGIALSYTKKAKAAHRPYLSTLINALTAILAGGILLAFFGLSQESIATVLGITAAGVAVALQQPILNAAGFISIKLASLYKKGDFIQIDGVLGRVEGISLMHTKVREYSRDGVEQGIFIFIPNAKALTMDVKNLTRPIEYVVDRVVVSLTYDSDVAGAIKALDKIAAKHLPKGRYWFRVDFAPSSVDVSLAYKTSFEEKPRLHSQLVEDIFAKLPGMAKADFAFPHRVVILKEERPSAKKGKGSPSPSSKKGSEA